MKVGNTNIFTSVNVKSLGLLIAVCKQNRSAPLNYKNDICLFTFNLLSIIKFMV